MSLDQDLRDAERVRQIDQFVQRLYRVWLTHPSQRLGQLVYNALAEAGIADPFYTDDSDFLIALERFAGKHL